MLPVRASLLHSSSTGTLRVLRLGRPKITHAPCSVVMQSPSGMEGQVASRASTPSLCHARPARRPTLEQAHLQPYQTPSNAAGYADIRQAPVSASLPSASASPGVFALACTQLNGAFRDGLRGFEGVHPSWENRDQQTQYNEPQHHWVPVPTPRQQPVGASTAHISTSGGLAVDGRVSVSASPEFSVGRLHGISPLSGGQNEHTNDETDLVSEASSGYGTNSTSRDLLPSDRHTRGADRGRDAAPLPDLPSDGQHAPGHYSPAEPNSAMSTEDSDNPRQGFVCWLCGKAFTAKHSLTRHQKQQ